MKARVSAVKFVGFFLVFGPILAGHRCDGSDPIREGKGEIFGRVSFLGGTQERDGPWQGEYGGWLYVNPGTVLQEDDWLLFGGGAGWNITNHWNINTEFLYASTDLTLEMPYGLDPAQGSRLTALFLLKIDYNVFAKSLTPFVSGGIGVGYWRDELRWDVYGGPEEISSDDLDTYDLGFAWAVGGGARWDITDWLFIKVSYEVIGVPSGDYRNGVSLSSGIMFR